MKNTSAHASVKFKLKVSRSIHQTGKLGSIGRTGIRFLLWVECVRSWMGRPPRYDCWDIVNAPTPRLRQERFLWRVYQEVMVQPWVHSWAMVSASVPYLSPQEGHARRDLLEHTLRSMRKGSFWFTACSEGSGALVFVVLNPSLEEACCLMKKYEQPVMLFSGPATGCRPALIHPNGTRKRFRQFQPAVVTEYLQNLCGELVHVQSKPFSVVEGRGIQAVLARRRREATQALDAGC